MDNNKKKVHHGYNIKLLREAQKLKQEALGIMVGLSQQTISKYESKEILDEEILLRFANALNVTLEIITDSFEESKIVLFKQQNSPEANIFQGLSRNISENQQKLDRLIHLCEGILKAENEKNVLLEKFILNIGKR